MQLFKVTRAKDAPGPGVLMLKLKGSHEMARGHSVELELDPDNEALLAELRLVYEVEPIEVRTPRADPERRAFLSGDRPPIQADEPPAAPAVPPVPAKVAAAVVTATPNLDAAAKPAEKE